MSEMKLLVAVGWLLGALTAAFPAYLAGRTTERSEITHEKSEKLKQQITAWAEACAKDIDGGVR